MNRFKDILCVLTPRSSSRIALRRAVSLAENNQANLNVISVMPPVSIGMGMSEGGPISALLQTAMLRTRTQELNAMVEPYLERIKIPARVLIGVQFLEIIREVLRGGHDLVIKVPEPQDWMDRLLGSEDMHLLRKCPCPVWMIKSAASKSYRRVLAAVDVSDAHPAAEKKSRRLLNQQIIDMAGSIAIGDFSELHIVHAWQAVDESILRGAMMQLQEGGFEAYVKEVKQQREANLTALLNAVTGDLGADVLDYLRPKAHLVEGRARRKIPELAKKLDADLIVIGTVARTGIPGFFSGNTAESILSQIDCSVLAIKPPGFKTPVTVP